MRRRRLAAFLFLEEGSSAWWGVLSAAVQRLDPMDIAFTSLPACRFYSLRVHFCTLHASLFFTPLDCFDRIWARLVATSTNFCLTGGRNGFSCWIPTIVSQLSSKLAILPSVSRRA